MTEASQPAVPRHAKLVRDNLVWDNCFSWLTYESLDVIGADKSLKATALPRYRAAGINVVSLTIGADIRRSHEQTLAWLASERRFISEVHRDECVIVDSVDDIERAWRAGKLAVTFHFQGGTPFLDSLGEEPGNVDLVQVYYDLGVRQALLAMNLRNAIADGCKEKSDAGLSNFGVKLVRAMNEVGMVLDCTHTGNRSTLEAMEISSKPVVFSHSNAKAVFDHPRNISDEQIRACARTGGVVGITGWGPIVNDRNDVSAEAIFKHLDHVAGLAGPEHVGIGLDYVYDPALTTARVRKYASLYAPYGSLEDYNYHWRPMGFAQPEVFVELTELMLKHGYPEAAITGILGGNWLRVARANWA